jgi:hypothetical protein
MKKVSLLAGLLLALLTAVLVVNTLNFSFRQC